jgi:hypothetical protein
VQPDHSEKPATYEIRRPFVQNIFNCIDLAAVCAFWISFILGFFDTADNRYFHLFRMLSSLRIMRLLRITPGTHNETVMILKGLKRAGSTLGWVIAFICYFLLLFAIVGVQSFKSSLKRRCHWSLDSASPNPFQFCGGHFDNNTGQKRP